MTTARLPAMLLVNNLCLKKSVLTNAVSQQRSASYIPNPFAACRLIKEDACTQTKYKQDNLFGVFARKKSTRRDELRVVFVTWSLSNESCFSDCQSISFVAIRTAAIGKKTSRISLKPSPPPSIMWIASNISWIPRALVSRLTSFS